MVKLNNQLIVGDRASISSEYLLFLLETMYRDIVEQLNLKPSVFFRPNDGLVTDYLLSNGDINVNINTLKIEMLVAHPTATTVTWVTIS